MTDYQRERDAQTRDAARRIANNRFSHYLEMALFGHSDLADPDVKSALRAYERAVSLRSDTNAASPLEAVRAAQEQVFCAVEDQIAISRRLRDAGQLAFYRSQRLNAQETE